MASENLTPPGWDRFWSKVDKASAFGCWLWIAGKMRGHGWFKIGERPFLAHRVAWGWLVGPVPEGLELLHLCDANYLPGDITYRACVNPAHMKTGTHAENMAWAKATFRSASGQRNGKSKLSNEQLVLLFESLAAGITTEQAVREFGIASRTVCGIRNGDRRSGFLARYLGAEKYAALRQKAMRGPKSNESEAA